MSTIIHLVAKSRKNRGNGSLFSIPAERFSGLSEKFWFISALILFVVMGPFSIIVVIIGLFSLANNKCNKEAAEPASS